MLHRHSDPMLVVVSGAWVTGQEELLISNFVKEDRAIAAQDSSDKENLALAVFENMVAVFEDHRPDSASPSMYRPDSVTGIEHDHPGDM